MSDKEKNEQVEISISEEDSSKRKSNYEKLISEVSDFFHGSPDTSLDVDGYHDLEKFEIIEKSVDAHRTLLLINEEDVKLYEVMGEWVKEQAKEQKVTLKETIAEFDPYKYNNSDALAKVIHCKKPDFIIKYENIKEDEKEQKEQKKKQIERKNFEILLLRSGLILEHEVDTDDKYTYIKIIAPFYALCEQAQQIKLKMRINKQHLPADVDLSVLDEFHPKKKSIFSIFSYDIDLKKESSTFKKNLIERFEGAESKEIAEISLKFFNTSRRNLLVHRMIITANQINRKIKFENNDVYVKRKVETLSIDELLDKKVFDKYYPIHDGSPDIKKDAKKFPNLRAQLSEIWVKNPGRQPLNKIREYFGEKLALYFAWLGLYTSWLSLASIAGVITVIYGIIDWATKRKSETYAEDGGISIIWDNALSAPYAFLMSIWATCFQEAWKRYNVSIQYDWDVTDYEKSELPRPRFYGTMLRTSPVTLKKEIHFPSSQRLVKFIISGIIVLISIAIVIVTVGVLIKFPRIWFQRLGFVAPIVTALVNLATIIILNMIYKNVARFLTNYENHRTETQFEDSLILKAYLFDFVNFYSVLIYIILAGSQACYDSCTLSNEICLDKCNKERGMIQITIQLAIIFIGRQLIGQIQEILIPWLLGKWNETKVKLERELLEKKYADKNKKVPQWVRDDNLASSMDNIKNEYEEMVIQFGFLALFGVAFPLAPLFAWLNNLSEVRSDAFKYIRTLQRPVGFQAQDIGMWENIMNILSFLAVLTNAVIIAFYSLWMERQFKKAVNYKDNDSDSNNRLLIARLGFILAFEHFVFIIKLIFAHLIPDVPKKVRVAMARENYLNRLALEGDPPVLDEYWSKKKNKDKDSLFSAGGSLLLPRTTIIGGNVRHKEFPSENTNNNKEKSKAE